MPLIYPASFESKVGFDKIRDILKGQCLSSLGREWVDDICFKTNPSEIERLTGETLEFVRILKEVESFPVSYYFDVRQALQKARVEGAFLETFELFDLKRSLDSIRGICTFFKNCKEDDFPYLKALSSNVVIYPYIFSRIEIILSKNGVIKDNASPELATIRKDMLQKQSQVSKRMQHILKSAIDEGLIDSDTSVSIRDGRPVIPIIAANKRKIKGIIHDESATGKTAFIEPTEIVELNNEIRELEYSEKREIIRILIAFTNDIRPYVDDLLLAYDFLGNIDFIRSKALFSADLDCIKPDIRSECVFDWINARHPLLVRSLRKEGRTVVPLNLTLDKKDRILLISGPNAGGKSVCLKTVGLLQYMLQCGLPVSMGIGSIMGIFDRLFIDIGDEQSIENDLSTYSSHLVNMKYFLRNSNENTLVLIDEFGTGTEPMLGGAIAESILNHLNLNKTFGVITTHYTNLKHFASSVEGIINGAMLYDSHHMEPLFTLQIGKPGSSFAFEIARKIGLPEEILQEATEKVGKDHINFDKHLRDIVRDKRYWETKRQKIHEQEKRLEGLVEKYKSELDETNMLRKDILNQAKLQASELLGTANKQIENTIREIREAQAEKEKTREVRKDLETFKLTLAEEKSDDERITQKIERLKERERRKAQNKQKVPDQAIEVPAKKKEEVDGLKPGDKVRLKGQESIGEILDADGKNMVVAFGNLRSTIAAARLEKVSSNEARNANRGENRTLANVHRKLFDRRLTFKSEIDVRGQRADEALTTIRDFIDEAIMLDVHEVR
ncbi:MAG: endonuclease MutS2, partial [Bacteroidota bacterium]|nr:endonuclease MutS2 [Bacteroidota bacterium]